jgi:uncharacterized membrane protein
MADMAENAKPKAPLWMCVTLFVSVALNLLVVGAVAGFFVTGGPDKRSDRTRTDYGAFFMRALSDEDRRALRRDFEAGLQRQGRDRGAFVTELQTTLEILRATPFDRDAFITSVADQSRGRAEREELGKEVLVNRIVAMTDAERAAYADRLEERLRDIANRIRR